MRPRALLLASLLLALPLSGCLEAMEESIEESRERARERRGERETPQESTQPRDDAPPPRPSPQEPTPRTPTVTTPTPTTRGPSPPWPREGSHARYEMGGVHEGPAGERVEWSAVAVWTYRDGDWRGACEGERRADGEREALRASYTPDDPPHWPLLGTRTPGPGTVETWHLRECDIRSVSMSYDGLRPARINGADTQVHRAVEPSATSSAEDFESTWDPRTGLVLTWSWTEDGGARATSGRLITTDAGLGG